MSDQPAWERLRRTNGARLNVLTPRRAQVDVLQVDDGDLPDFDGATIINAERKAEGFEVWAVRIDGGVASTLIVGARRLRVVASDTALARLLGLDAHRPTGDVEWTPREPEHAAQRPSGTGGQPQSGDEVICACEGITRSQIEAATEAGLRSVDAVKRATKATFGECQSRRCAAAIAEIIGLASGDPRAAITPRPPLVPVPASVLAVFGARRSPPPEQDR